MVIWARICIYFILKSINDANVGEIIEFKRHAYYFIDHFEISTQNFKYEIMMYIYHFSGGFSCGNNSISWDGTMEWG